VVGYFIAYGLGAIAVFLPSFQRLAAFMLMPGMAVFFTGLGNALPAISNSIIITYGIIITCTIPAISILLYFLGLGKRRKTDQKSNKE